MKQFRCPECGSFHFGTSFDRLQISGRSCHDEFGVGCRWSGSDEECFVENRLKSAGELHGEALRYLVSGNIRRAYTREARVMNIVDREQPAYAIICFSAASIAFKCDLLTHVIKPRDSKLPAGTRCGSKCGG